MQSKNLKLNVYLGGIICLIFALFLFWPSCLMAQEEVVLTQFIDSDVDCVDSTATVDLSWTSTLDGDPDYYILRKIEGEADFIEIDNVNNISYTDNSINSDKTYVYQIRAERGVEIYYSNHVTTTKKAYCPPILQPSSTSCHNDGPYINLSWTPVSGDLLTYEIYRKDPGESGYLLLPIGDFTEAYYEDGPDIIGTETYYYYIKSVWQDGASAHYDPEYAETIPACEPTLSVSSDCLDDTAPGGPVINLSWNKLLGISSYQIYRQAPGESDFSFLDNGIITDEEITTFSDQLVESLPNAYYNSGTINYKVKAVWETAQRDSSVSLIDIPRCQPFLSITNNCDSFSFNLKWTATQGDNIVYIIYRNEVQVGQALGITNTSYEDGLGPAICPGDSCTHNYSIKAFVNVIEDVLYSDTVSASINCTAAVAPSPAPILNEPTISCYLGKSLVHLSWSASDNVTYYMVYRTSEGATSELIALAAEYLDDIAAPYEYTYWVRAYGKGGWYIDGPNAFVVTAIDCSVPAKPELSLAVECDSEGPSLNLSWTESANVYGYNIYKGLDDDNLNLLIALSKDITNFSDDVVSPSIQYYYKVVANGPPAAEGEYLIQSESEIQSIAALCLPTEPILTVSNICSSGDPTIDLDWTTDGLKTFSYEIFRKDFSEDTAFATIGNIAERHWEDDSVDLDITYEYKVEAIGYESTIRSTDGYKSIIASCPPTTPSLSLSKTCVLGNPLVDLNWATDEANTIRYEIFRKDSSETSLVYTINDTLIKDWQDDSVAMLTEYEYKVEAVGYNDERSTQGYKPIITDDCPPPGSFILSDAFYCQESYPRVDLSWTDSYDADSYDISRNLLNPDNSTAGTITFYDKTSIYTDWGQGNALSFDGIDDYVSIPDDDSLNLNIITMEAWIYPTGFNYWGHIIYKSRYKLRLYYYTGRVESYVYVNGGLRGCTTPDDIAVSLNQWNHVVSTYDGNNIKVYINGVEGCSRSYSPTGNIDIAESALQIGSYYTFSTGTYRFKGTIDDVRIYGRALAEIEVQEHYQGIFNNESNLTGLWRFDEGSGNSASDSANEGNNGTILGATWTQNGLQSAERYSWQVDANGGEETSDLTDPVELSCPPVKPGLVLEKACNASGAIVELLWSYSYGATSFEIYRQGAANPIGAVTLADPRNWTDDNAGAGLAPLTEYTYMVKSIGPGGQTDSDFLTVTTYNCSPPTQPQELEADFFCSGSDPRIALLWNASGYTTYYAIYRNGSFLINTTDAEFTDYNIFVDTAYTYTVSAFGPGGESESSDPAEISTGNYCVPSALYNIFLINTCESGLSINTLSWTDATSLNTGHYNIYRNGTTIDDLILPPTPQGTLSYVDSDPPIAILTDYIYYIKAIGPTGLEGTLSSSNNITTYTCGVQPAAPALSLGAVVPNPYCVDNIPYVDLNWAGVDNAYSYNLYRDNPDASQSVYPTVVSVLTDKGDYALNFDGSNSYVSIPDDDSLNPNIITMEAWIYPTGFNYWGHIIYKSRYKLRLYYYTGRVESYVYVNGGLRGCTTPDDIAVSLNQWNHVVSTYDGNNIKVYINGVEGCSRSYSPTGNIDIAESALQIGSYYTFSTGTYRFKGTIDDVRIYGRALSLTEIQEHYNNIYKNETDLRGVWHFNEASGDTAFDSSSNGNNGRLGSSIGADSYDPTWEIPFNKTGYVARLYSNSTYEYTIKAIGVDEESYFSDSVQINTPTCLNPPEFFGLYNRCTDYNNPVTVPYWENQKNVTEYQVYKDGVLFDESRAPADFISKDGYIKHWLLIGPYENNYNSDTGQWEGYYTDYIDEEDIIPRAGETAEGNIWFDYYSTSDKIDFFNIFLPNNINRVAYAFSYIYSPIDQAAELWIGSGDGVKAFLNGVEIHGNPEHGSAVAEQDQDKISVNLIAGINTLLIKVDQGTDDWALYVRIVDASGDNILDYITTWDSEAVSGESADYYVKAKILDEESNASDILSSNPLGCQPAKPDLEVVAGCVSGISKLFLSWGEDPNDFTQSFTIYKKGPSDDDWLSAYGFPISLDKTETAYADSNVTSDITYQYYVDAVGKGISIFSDAISKKTIICYPAPDKPEITINTLCFGDYPRMGITWTDEEGGEVDNAIAFNILRKNVTVEEPEYIKIETGLSSEATSYEDRIGVNALNEYYYKVEAVGAGEDNSQLSDSYPLDPDEFAIAALDCANIPPRAPTLAIGVVDAYGLYAYVSLAWIDSGNEDKYIVLRDGVKIAELVQGTADYIEDDPIIYYTDGTVSDNTTYIYVIRAINDNDPGITDSDPETAIVPTARPGNFTLSISWAQDTEEALLSWTEAASTISGGIVNYTVLRNSITDFTGVEALSSDCEDITVAPFECADAGATLLERYYRVEATNIRGTTNSNTVDIISVILPTWKEVKP